MAGVTVLVSYSGLGLVYSYFFIITRLTPDSIKNTPTEILNVKAPPKNNSENTMALIGSSAPSRAVLVEPISFIAIFIVSIEIIVGKIAINIAQIKTIGELIGSICVQNLEFTT